MGRRTTEEGALIKAYMKHAGCSERTARRAREADSDAWRTFLRSQGLVKPAGGPLRPMTALQKAVADEAEAWDACQEFDRMRKTCGPDTKIALAGAAKKAQERHHAAMLHLSRMQEQAGKLVQVSVIRDIQTAMIAPLGRMYADLRDAIAAQLPPAARAAFYTAWQREYPAREKMLHELDGKLESFLSCDA